jgi:hypothetical protein
MAAGVGHIIHTSILKGDAAPMALAGRRARRRARRRALREIILPCRFPPWRGAAMRVRLT